MKIQYCSDLHLEFPKNKEFLRLNPLSSMGDILLLAGDIVPFAYMDAHDDFFDQIADNFEATYWVPGNHEYYRADIANRGGQLNEKIRSNIFLVNNRAIILHGIKFIFTTLWSEITPPNLVEIQQRLSDFHVIRMQGNPFTPDHYNTLHQESRMFLEQELGVKKADKHVVVTHHVPTFQHYPPRFKGNTLNEAFAVELDDLIEPSGVDYWIYGHHHQAIPEFTIGETRLITNQLGYVNYNEHVGFNTGALIDI